MDTKIEVEPRILKEAFRKYLRMLPNIPDIKEQQVHWNTFWFILRENCEVYVKMNNKRMSPTAPGLELDKE